MADVFQLPKTIYTGMGSIDQLREVIEQNKVKAILIVTDQGIINANILQVLEDELNKSNVSWEVWAGVEAEPSVKVIDIAATTIAAHKPDMIIAIGGGSVIDTAKLASAAEAHHKSVAELLEKGIIINEGRLVVAIPTTSGTGSEVTPIAIVTVPDQILKVGVVAAKLIPQIVIIDPLLTQTVPSRLTASTGIDALSHAIESVFSQRNSALTEPYCYEAIKRIGRSLSRAVWSGSDVAAREDMALASLFAGIGLSNAGVGAVHAISYPIGGKYNISHGECIALLLVEVLKYMLPAAVEPFARIAQALDVATEGLSMRDAAEGGLHAIDQLIADLNLPRKLVDYGVDKSELKQLASSAASIERLIHNSPRILDVKEIEQILFAVYA